MEFIIEFLKGLMNMLPGGLIVKTCVVVIFICISVLTLTIIYRKAECEAEFKKSLIYREEYLRKIYPIYTALEIFRLYDTKKTKICLFNAIDELSIRIELMKSRREHPGYKYQISMDEFNRLIKFEEIILDWSNSMRQIPVNNIDNGMDELFIQIDTYFKFNNRFIKFLFNHYEAEDYINQEEDYINKEEEHLINTNNNEEYIDDNDFVSSTFHKRKSNFTNNLGRRTDTTYLRKTGLLNEINDILEG